jgi:hypothetical protein
MASWAAMLSEKDFVAVSWVLSVTWTVKLNVPPVVGVPVMLPPGLKFKPPGGAPKVMAQLYGGVPPLADTVCE